MKNLRLHYPQEIVMTKKKILFFIESLGGGGAEKVLSTIVKHIDTQRFDVTVCVITAGGKYDEEVATHVRLLSLLNQPEAYRGVGKFWYWLKYHLIYDWLHLSWVYKLFLPQKSDVEIAFVEGFATKLLSFSTNSKAKKIAWVHCDLKNQPWPIQKGIYKSKEEETNVYRRYHKVVCVSKQAEGVMKEYYGLSNTMTIYNPLDCKAILQLAKQPVMMSVDTTEFNVISVGRLERVKGFDMLIPIIRNVRENGVNVHLWIVGEGTEEKALKLLAFEKGLENDVTFTGFMKNPYALMSKMNLFVCSSRAEGFSLVLAEAMTLGVPVVSMNCAGPQELINMTDIGTLCDSYEELEKALIKASRVKKHQQGVVTPYDVVTIIPQIEELLGNETKGKI